MDSLLRLYYYSRIYTAKKDSRAIVFIDSQVLNLATIVQRVDFRARAIVLGSDTDGIKEITRILAHSSCQQVYIVARGYPGCLYLGSSELSSNTLLCYQKELQNWFDLRAIASNTNTAPQLFLYGCNCAAGDGGEEFLIKLARTTKAQITASRKILSQIIFTCS